MKKDYQDYILKTITALKAITAISLILLAGFCSLNCVTDKNVDN